MKKLHYPTLSLTSILTLKTDDPTVRPKRRHHGWHPRAHVKLNFKPSKLRGGLHMTSESPAKVLILT